MRRRIEQLEALRGLAAFYVVVHHTLPHFYYVGGFNIGNFNRLGQEAVILFFLISGFVIKYAFESSRDKRFSVYFQKRLYRIYIPLVIVLAIGYISMSINAGHWIDPELGQLFGNLFMLQDYVGVKPNVWVDTYLDNGPLWSLSYEWWFYMLFFPITVFIKRGADQDNLVFLSAVLATVLHHYLPIFPVRIVMYLGLWWAGVHLARNYLSGDIHRWQSFAKPVVTLTTISLILVVNVVDKLPVDGVSPGFYPWLELRHFVFADMAIIAGYAWYRLRWIGFDTVLRPFLWLAPISYTVYISHVYLFTESTFLQSIPSMWIRYPLYLALVIVVSFLIERIIYPPLQRKLMRR